MARRGPWQALIRSANVAMDRTDDSRFRWLMALLRRTAASAMDRGPLLRWQQPSTQTCIPGVDWVAWRVTKHPDLALMKASVATKRINEGGDMRFVQALGRATREDMLRLNR